MVSALESANPLDSDVRVLTLSSPPLGAEKMATESAVAVQTGIAAPFDGCLEGGFKAANKLASKSQDVKLVKDSEKVRC
jgi:hypothetical protein